MELEAENKKAAVHPLPLISKYSCYRHFLKDFFNYKKSLKNSFSYRQFSQMVGLKSPNYLQLVIQGKRNLTLSTADSVAKAMKLKPTEAKYFVALVAQDSAETVDEKRRAEKLVFQTARHMQTRFAELNQNELFKKWYHPAVRELAQLKDFEPSGEYISRKLSGLISPVEAEQSLKLLIELGLLKVEDGKYIVADSVYDAGTDIFQHSLMQEFHGQQLEVWSKHLKNLGGKDQELGLINLSIPRDRIPELIEKIRTFQDEVIGWLQGSNECDQLVQLGTYLMAFEEGDETLTQSASEDSIFQRDLRNRSKRL